MLHPVVVAAIALLVVNDRVLKETVARAGHRQVVRYCRSLPPAASSDDRPAIRLSSPWRPDSLLAICIVITFVGFAAVKLSPSIATLYGEILGLVR